MATVDMTFEFVELHFQMDRGDAGPPVSDRLRPEVTIS